MSSVLHSPKDKSPTPQGSGPGGLPPEPGDETKKPKEDGPTVESSTESKRVSDIPKITVMIRPPGVKDIKLIDPEDPEDHMDQEDDNSPNSTDSEISGNSAKRGRGSNKRRHSFSGVDGQFEQLVLVVNSLSDCMGDYTKVMEKTRTQNIKRIIEEKKTRSNLEDLINEILNLKDVVVNLSQQVDEQKTTIKGLIVGDVSLKDTTGIQEKLKEVMQEELKALKDTVEEQGEKSAKITQKTADSASQLRTEILNQVTKSQEVVPQTMTDEVNLNMLQNALEENRMMSTQSNQFNQQRAKTITRSDGSQFLQRLPNFQNDASTNRYLDAARNALLQGGNPQANDPPRVVQNGPPKEAQNQGMEDINEEIDLMTTSSSNYNQNMRGNPARGNFPPGANPQENHKYNHRQNNKGIFQENTNNGPKTVRRDSPEFDEKGDLHWVTDYVDVPYISDQQKKRREKTDRKDQNKSDKEIVLFEIPTKDKDNKIHTKDYDNAQVVRVLKELKKGGFVLKDKIHIVHTLRQVRNDRHPDHIPITITLSSKEVVDEILLAAADMGLIGRRTLKQGENAEVKFGFIRRSLTQRERNDIKERKKFNKTKIGQNQAKLKRREEDSRTDKDEWSEMHIEEDPTEEEAMELTNQDNAPEGGGDKEAENKALEKRVADLLATVGLLQAKNDEATKKAEIIQTKTPGSE